jgi:hypothetical protein
MFRVSPSSSLNDVTRPGPIPDALQMFPYSVTENTIPHPAREQTQNQQWGFLPPQMDRLIPFDEQSYDEDDLDEPEN